ncbi:hypothetical protein Pmi06nite_79410 [Planotetraspora mira]|uniref:Uncharacterized protein n=1 Tax=Planotetraspora mira TaxID=58121 RepID=A0A8J3U1U5_9ACTN|nr:hypothetical protein Pmi06nite_79410 [Planotetraspora mira]
MAAPYIEPCEMIVNEDGSPLARSCGPPERSSRVPDTWEAIRITRKKLRSTLAGEGTGRWSDWQTVASCNRGRTAPAIAFAGVRHGDEMGVCAEVERTEGHERFAGAGLQVDSRPGLTPVAGALHSGWLDSRIPLRHRPV